MLLQKGAMESYDIAGKLSYELRLVGGVCCVKKMLETEHVRIVLENSREVSLMLFLYISVYKFLCYK